MAIPVYEEVTFFYEVLMRFSDQPGNLGKLSGALLRTLTITTKDGVRIGTQENPPQQLALVEGEDGQQLGEVLGQANAQTIIDNQILAAENQRLLANIDELLATNQTLDADLTRTESELTTAQAEIQRLTALVNQQSALTAPEQEVEATPQ